MTASAATADPGQLWSPVQLGEYLGVPVATLYQWRHKGEGPPGIRVGKHVRYRTAAVQAWLDAKQDAG